ncbi:MAG: autotransporter-associated beta strand repeat-containing protein [Verrucomicrobia bacterium]|nr:autotransporter-associated beta strand repeat-containing protein [Verrucomicrobiota bacterium]MCH8528014.1 autotransporter-associated beta strand repeat-containing protein [Kiritimatiellia bacterium]
MNKTQKASILAFAAALLLNPSTVFADDGSWNTDANGNWDSSFASGAGNTATFANNITADRTISLIEPITIGNIIFGNADTTTPGGWTINNNSNPLNILTLAGGTPTITVNPMGSGTSAVISAVLAGTDGFTKNGSGGLVLSGANTISGPINLNEGRIIARNSSALGTGVLNMTSGTNLHLQNGLNISNTLNIIGTGNDSSSAIFAAGVGGVGSAHTLSGTVNLLGNARITGANVGGNNQITLSGTLNLGTHNLQTTSSGSAGQIFITGEITGSGRLELSQGHLTVTNANTNFTGNTRITGGAPTLFVGDDQAFGSGTIEFAVNTDNQTIFRSTNSTDRTIANNLSFTGGNNNSRYIFGGGNSGNLLFTGDATLANLRGFRIANAQTEFSGNISGNGGIRQETNNGTLILSGNNTYTGATLVNAGTMLINGTHTGGGAFEVNNGGTLGGSGSIGSNVAVNDGGTLSAGNSAGVLTINGDLTLNAGSTTLAEIGGFTRGTEYDGYDISGELTYGGTLNIVSINSWDLDTPGTFELFNAFSSFTGNFDAVNVGSTALSSSGTLWTSGEYSFDLGTGNLTVIPEPGTLALVGLSLLALAVFRKHGKH